MLFIVLCTRKLYTLQSFPLWLRFFPPCSFLTRNLVGFHWKSFLWYNFTWRTFYEFINADLCWRGWDVSCGVRFTHEIFPVFVSLVCVHLPIYNSVSVCHRSDGKTLIFCWSFCHSRININIQMNQDRPIADCRRILMFFPMQWQKNSRYFVENSLQPECGLVIFNLQKNQTGKLEPVNAIYVPTHKIIIIHFNCDRNCKWQCQRFKC